MNTPAIELVDVHKKFGAKADRQHASGKRMIRDGAVEQVISRFQFRIGISLARAQLHWIGGEVESRAE